MNQAKGRAFIIADHPIVQGALDLLLTEQAGALITVVGAGGWHPGALAALSAAQPDVVILAVGVEALNELRILTTVQQQVPRAYTIVIDTMGEGDYAHSVNPSPVDAMLALDQLPGELITVLERLLTPATKQRIGPQPLR